MFLKQRFLGICSLSLFLIYKGNDVQYNHGTASNVSGQSNTYLREGVIVCRDFFTFDYFAKKVKIDNSITWIRESIDSPQPGNSKSFC